MSETAAEQRERIIAESGVPAWGYDLAVALGYEPESYDGMWKLTPDPFTFRESVVIAREFVYEPGTHVAVLEGDSFKTRLKAHRWPEDFSVIETTRLTGPKTYGLGRYQVAARHSK